MDSTVSARAVAGNSTKPELCHFVQRSVETPSRNCACFKTIRRLEPQCSNLFRHSETVHQYKALVGYAEARPIPRSLLRIEQLLKPPIGGVDFQHQSYLFRRRWRELFTDRDERKPEVISSGL